MTDFPLLAGLGEDERREVLAIARRRTFERGEIVFHRDDPGDTVHLVLRGRFSVRIVTPMGDAATLAVVSAGETFGELALLAPGSRRSATVTALEASETRSILRSDFEGLARRHPEVKDFMINVLTAHVRRLSTRLVEALYVPADRRVLRRLAELCALYGDTAIPLTQEDIAGLAGTTRATVNRVLRAEQRRGTIELQRGRTVVLDPETLGAHAR